MKDKTAPRVGCPCTVCQWVRVKAEEKWREDDLTENYRRYQAGELVSRDVKE